VSASQRHGIGGSEVRYDVTSDRYVLGLDEVDRTSIELVGGKAAHLGELARIDGIRVPPGFCVTNGAYRRALASVPSIDDRLDRLSQVDDGDREAIRALSAEVRAAVDRIAIPDDVAAAIELALEQLGARSPVAVRSSASAEDSATASFAGQHDTYLNILGPAAVLDHVRRCWASLFSEQAATYRLRNGIDAAGLGMAVVVQRMVEADAAGVVFTADPLTGNRTVTSVEAILGLGEALVAGRANADAYEVRDGSITAATVADDQPVLTDAEVLRLTELSGTIERHFGCPQDIEWCLVDGDFQFVQSRPITTLFPVPDVGDGKPHVFVSVGHQQMMTDAMKPLGLSVWQLTAGRPMYDAGGRLFVDVIDTLASPDRRASLMEMLGRSEPLIGDALRTVVERGDIVPPPADDGPRAAGPVTTATAAAAVLDADEATVTELIARSEASHAELRREIRTKSGPGLFDFILDDIQVLRRELFNAQSLAVIMAGIEAAWWLSERMQAWLGEKNAADTLTQSVPHNVTSEMGLALLDVADVARAHPDVVAVLEHAEDAGFLDEMTKRAGGRETRAAIEAWLDRFGVRCVGEIDISRPRWAECPELLVPMILGNIRNFESGESGRRFEAGRHEALQKKAELLARVRELPDGDARAGETERMIDRVRTFSGYREYPKYAMVSRYFSYKQALLNEAAQLVRARVLGEADDIFYLRFDELHGVARTNGVDAELIARRKEAFRRHRTLTPPRVLTSDGEIITGEYRRDDFPKGALVGLAVSAGSVEGRARVVLDVSEADLVPGDILVTAYTDPSWTPLFVTVGALVTEVGGLMTHGVVVAREYGLPAVVGVEGATRRIEDGQRIRVNGTDGYVELLATT
jgi:pyruvate,water dikinase